MARLQAAGTRDRVDAERAPRRCRAGTRRRSRSRPRGPRRRRPQEVRRPRRARGTAAAKASEAEERRQLVVEEHRREHGDEASGRERDRGEPPLAGDELVRRVPHEQDEAEERQQRPPEGELPRCGAWHLASRPPARERSPEGRARAGRSRRARSTTAPWRARVPAPWPRSSARATRRCRATRRGSGRCARVPCASAVDVRHVRVLVRARFDEHRAPRDRDRDQRDHESATPEPHDHSLHYAYRRYDRVMKWVLVGVLAVLVGGATAGQAGNARLQHVTLIGDSVADGIAGDSAAVAIVSQGDRPRPRGGGVPARRPGELPGRRRPAAERRRARADDGVEARAERGRRGGLQRLRGSVRAEHRDRARRSQGGRCRAACGG